MSSRRINAVLPENAYRDLEALAEEQGESKTEVLRGGKVLVERDGEIREIIPR